LVAICAAAFLYSATSSGGGTNKLVVHEWGTFTSLQNEHGKQLGGINIDDEPVPKFVHNLNPHVLSSSYTLHQVHSKGAPQRHPYVNVRLETPVIYFYPPEGQKGPMKVDVDVSFRGGWLTEFYPHADAYAPGLKQNSFEFGPITPSTTGRLSWRDLRIGTDRSGPQTNENVWLAPRKTEATPVETPEGEAEKYLFYRGVGNFKAPLAISNSADQKQFAIRGNFSEVLTSGEQVTIEHSWLVHIRPDGKTAFRRMRPFAVTADDGQIAATVSSTFSESDYKGGHIHKLKAEMHAALVEDGLFEDEAHAMLATWDRAYFQKHGLRVFFSVPREWTDHRLPLHVSVPAEITRVMVGRIELVSPEQQAILDRLSQTATSSPNWMNNLWESPKISEFMKGNIDLADMNVQIPPDYQMYMDLGRFRNALLIAQYHRHPTENLRKFIATYHLEEFQPPGEDAVTARRYRPGGGGE
jgi:hypothetical protein